MQGYLITHELPSPSVKDWRSCKACSSSGERRAPMARPSRPHVARAMLVSAGEASFESYRDMYSREEGSRPVSMRHQVNAVVYGLYIAIARGVRSIVPLSRADPARRPQHTVSPCAQRGKKPGTANTSHESVDGSYLSAELSHEAPSNPPSASKPPSSTVTACDMRAWQSGATAVHCRASGSYRSTDAVTTSAPFSAVAVSPPTAYSWPRSAASAWR
mmetsp:Transcript_20758/g.47535  ORF Transcript_20758/g.47535 Transcript_20758/m.47535 type:complete len:217 (+) Transcript_20758:429-1079(+)